MKKDTQSVKSVEIVTFLMKQDIQSVKLVEIITLCNNVTKLQCTESQHTSVCDTKLTHQKSKTEAALISILLHEFSSSYTVYMPL